MLTGESMATNNTINIGLNVSSNGTLANETKQARALNTELEKAAKTSARVPGPVKAARGNTPEVDNSGDSGKARGIGGQTGAGARDFAKQASGLGGLVHVYATFAANLFAVSAGFQALSKAADVTNMVKGLDQLGAASGRNLGTLSKQLAAATDNAISLQEAMAATAQASAGGMSSENILRLGKVAKQASQALGIDMTNAVSRLSRGITKIEPELLDELGIMVRVDKAAQDYARTVGKTAASLTDFERRQAFANAVLQQGEEKFGNIKLDANPYQKILASIQNLSQAGLELVNKVLGPIADYLSKSPTALTGVLAGIATLLLRQALPAITSWREGLKHAAVAADEAAIKLNDVRKAKAFAFDEKIIDKYSQSYVNAMAAMKKSRDDLALAKSAKAIDATSAAFKAIGVEPKSLQEAEDQITKVSKRIARSRKELEDASLPHSRANILRTELDLYGKHVEALNKYKAAFTDLSSLEEEKAKGRFQRLISAENLNQRIADKAQKRARAANIVSGAVDISQSVGAREAFGKLFSDVKLAKDGMFELNGEIKKGEKPMGAMQRGMTLLQGSTAIVTSKITQLASAFSNIFMVVGIAIAVFEVLNSMFSKSEKEMAAFEEATNSVEGAVANLGRTMETIYGKSADKVFSLESIQAKATAQLELANSLESQEKAFIKLISTMGAWDKGWDSIKDIFGAGSVDKLAKGFGQGIDNVFASIGNPEKLNGLRKEIQAIVGSTNIKTGKDLEKFLDTLDRTDAANKVNLISKAVTALATEANNNASKFATLNNSIDQLSKTYIDTVNSLKLSDNLAKLSDDMFKVGIDFEKALKEPTESLDTFIKLLKGEKLPAIFGPNQIAEASQFATAMEKVQKEAGLAVKELENAKKAELLAKPEQVIQYSNSGEVGYTMDNTAVEEAKARRENAEYRVKAATKEVEVTAKLFKDKFGNLNLFESSQRFLAASIKQAFDLAAISGAKTYLSVLQKAGLDTTVEDIKLQQNDIAVRIRGIEVQEELIKTTAENNNIQKIVSNLLERGVQEKLLSERSDSVRENAQTRINALDKERDTLLSFSNMFKTLNIKQLATSKTLTEDQKRFITEGLGKGQYDSLVGINAQKAQLSSNSAALAASRRVAEANRPIDETIKNYSIEKQRIELKQLELSLVSALGIAQTESTINASKELEIEKLKNAESIQQEEIKKKLNAINEAISNKMTGAAELRLAEAEKNRVEAERDILNQKIKLDILKLSLNAYKSTLDITRQQNELEAEMASRRSKAIVSVEEAKLDNAEKLLDIFKEQGIFSETAIAKSKQNLAIIKQELQNEQTLSELRKSHSSQLATANDKVSVAKRANSESPSTVNAEALAKEIKNRDDLQATLEVEFEAVKRVNDEKLRGVTVTTQATIENAKFADVMQRLANTTNSLEIVFGNFGKGLSDVLSTFEEFSKKQQDYENARAELAKKESAASNFKEKLQYATQIGELDAKNAQEKENFTLKELSNFKKLFGEKSKGYKVVSSIEKAAHVASLAMKAKDIITNIPVIASNVATGVSKLFAQGGWAGFAGAAAFLAIMATLGFGGKSASQPKGFTAEEKSKTDGTGAQAYDSTGKLMATGGGVKGDIFAKSQDLVNSIDIVAANTNNQLEYSNSQLETLLAIRENTSNLAGLLVSIPGIQSGKSVFNTIEGSSKSFAGFNKNSTEILDAGVKVVGTLEGIVTNANDTLYQLYETVKTTSSSWWGLSKDVNTKTDTKSLDTATITAVQKIFSSVKEAILDSTSVLTGSTYEDISKLISSANIDLSVSTLGKTGEEITKALEAQVGVETNKLVEKAFPYLVQFQKMNEGMLTTLARVTKDITSVNTAFKSIGINFSTKVEEVFGSVNESAIRLYEGMVKAAGGLDKFISKNNFYRDNFLTEAQKVGPIQAEVTRELKDMGLAGVKTKEDFVKIVQGLDLTSESGANTYSKLMDLAEGFNTVANYTEKIRSAQVSQQITNTRLLGNADEALDLARKEELKTLDPLLVAGRQRQYQLEDEAKLTKLDIELLSAQGKSYAALLLQREEELKLLTEAERLTKIAIYDAQDIAKTRNLEVEALQASGQAYKALLLQREQELLGLSDRDKALKKQIWAAQDAVKLRNLEVEALSAMGYAYAAVKIQREYELQGLSEEEKQLKRTIYTLQDAAKTKDLEIELLEASGKTSEALLERRRLELKGLSATDAELKRRIWLLQDEKKLMDARNDQEVRIYELLGKSEEALRITRAKELAEMDPQLRASQLYIYALEDEASLRDKLTEAYDKEKSALKDTISNLKTATNTLREFRDSLLLSEKSTLTPAQKYAEAKRQYLQTAAVATSIAISDAQKEAKAAALDKLPNIADQFLEASRTLYASSDAYTADFSMVLKTLDSTANAIDDQMSNAEKQLTALEDSVSALNLIETNTETTATLLGKLATAIENTATAKTAAANSGSAAAGGTLTTPTVTPVVAASAQVLQSSQDPNSGYIVGTKGWQATFAEAREYINKMVGAGQAATLLAEIKNQGLTSSMVDIILGQKAGFTTQWVKDHGLGTFAAGGLASGLSLVGEKGPEFVDFNNPGRVYDANKTSLMLSNDALLKEVQQMREEIKQLRIEQRENTGNVITSNYDANNRAADMIVKAGEAAANTSSWKNRNIPKIA